MSGKHAVVSGPNGSLGPAVITNLLKGGFKVTILTRNPDQTKESFPQAEVAVADYSSVSQLTSTLKGLGKVDGVVCLINRGQDAYQSQINLIDATIAADIPHYIPSSFGGDMRDPAFRDLPPLIAKRDMEDYVVKKATEGSLIYTIINQGLLLDWAMDRNIYLNFDGQPVRLFDHGKPRVSATVLDDVGKAVTTALLKRDQVANKYCFINSAQITQLEMLALWQELKPDEKFETVNIDTEQMAKQSEENYKKGDLSPAAMRGYIIRCSIGSDAGAFKHVDNELLGVKEWSKQELKDLIAKYAK